MARRHQNGFTFVELMAVIFIIGLAAAAVVLAVPEPGGSLQREAERFAARAKAARDAAIVEARPIALTVDADGYDVLQRSGGAWRERARHGWVAGTVPETADRAGLRTRFDSTGLAEPVTVVLARGERRVAVAIGQDGSVRVVR